MDQSNSAEVAVSQPSSSVKNASKYVLITDGPLPSLDPPQPSRAPVEQPCSPAQKPACPPNNQLQTGFTAADLIATPKRSDQNSDAGSRSSRKSHRGGARTRFQKAVKAWKENNKQGPRPIRSDFKKKKPAPPATEADKPEPTEPRKPENKGAKTKSPEARQQNSTKPKQQKTPWAKDPKNPANFNEQEWRSKMKARDATIVKLLDELRAVREHAEAAEVARAVAEQRSREQMSLAAQLQQRVAALEQAHSCASQQENTQCAQPQASSKSEPPTVMTTTKSTTSEFVPVSKTCERLRNIPVIRPIGMRPVIQKSQRPANADEPPNYLPPPPPTVVAQVDVPKKEKKQPPPRPPPPVRKPAAAQKLPGVEKPAQAQKFESIRPEADKNRGKQPAPKEKGPGGSKDPAATNTPAGSTEKPSAAEQKPAKKEAGSGDEPPPTPAGNKGSACVGTGNDACVQAGRDNLSTAGLADLDESFARYIKARTILLPRDVVLYSSLNGYIRTWLKSKGIEEPPLEMMDLLAARALQIISPSEVEQQLMDVLEDPMVRISQEKLNKGLKNQVTMINKRKQKRYARGQMSTGDMVLDVFTFGAVTRKYKKAYLEGHTPKGYVRCSVNTGAAQGNGPSPSARA
ncbi:MAG: hypothetical protein FDSTV2_gp1 [Fushun diaea subdola tombus-like virus 2]|nr:MAG: hypothetical protein FDSTV2_gp1 [Fushun diaea subdola tombus-like virus 2]